jgi:hypothetical protein
MDKYYLSSNFSKIVNFQTSMGSEYIRERSESLGQVGKLLELPDGNLLFMDWFGSVKVYQARMQDSVEELKTWKKLTGSIGQENLEITFHGDDADDMQADNGPPLMEGKVKRKGNGDGDGGGDGEGGADG